MVSGSTPSLSALLCSAQPMPPAKPGPVQEDAGALVLSGPQVRLAVVLVHLEVALAAQPLVAELPVVVGQLLDRVVESGDVVVVGHERAVAAAAVVGRPATVPWQAGVPNTHVHRDSSHVMSAAIRCSGLSGS